jgi:hypothetical protein
MKIKLKMHKSFIFLESFNAHTSNSYLTFLSHLNLSFNNLSGKIPNGNQLQTLNDSSIYEGNSLLCGPPLWTKCSEDETKPRVANENGRGIESTSFYIAW